MNPSPLSLDADVKDLARLCPNPDLEVQGGRGPGAYTQYRSETGTAGTIDTTERDELASVVPRTGFEFPTWSLRTPSEGAVWRRCQCIHVRSAHIRRAIYMQGVGSLVLMRRIKSLNESTWDTRSGGNAEVTVQDARRVAKANTITSNKTWHMHTQNPT